VLNDGIHLGRGKNTISLPVEKPQTNTKKRHNKHWKADVYRNILKNSIPT
jgi:hypothetical protein